MGLGPRSDGLHPSLGYAAPSGLSQRSALLPLSGGRGVMPRRGPAEKRFQVAQRHVGKFRQDFPTSRQGLGNVRRRRSPAATKAPQLPLSGGRGVLPRRSPAATEAPSPIRPARSRPTFRDSPGTAWPFPSGPAPGPGPACRLATSSGRTAP